jgi:sugar lactone lactonase YvrE
MKATRLIAALCVLVLGSGLSPASADDPRQFPQNATFTTFAITPFAIEGLTGDAAGNLYTTGRQTDLTKNCPVWRIGPDGARVTVAFIPNPTGCNPSGITFDSGGDLYIADAATIAGVSGIVWRVTPHPFGCQSDDSTSPLCASVPLAMAFATGVPGTNGLAFDRHGNLFTGDGTTGQGRVWRITPTPSGSVCESSAGPSFVGCVEAFRIQAMANVLLVNGLVVNVGRDARTLPPGTIDAARAATNALGSQPLVANGVAFNREGHLYIADTARGAIWKVEFDRDGNLKSPTGCDSTFTANTLCLDNVFVAHPYLEGTDGIALDRAGNIWNSANERNAIVVVTKDGRVAEVFRNPANAAGLRNSADAAVGNNHILEFPASPFLSGKRLCTSNSDGDRRDNSPRAAGEINAGGAVGARGKISCMDQELKIPGLPLPVH